MLAKCLFDDLFKWYYVAYKEVYKWDITRLAFVGRDLACKTVETFASGGLNCADEFNKGFV